MAHAPQSVGAKMERKLSKAEQCRNLMYKRAMVEELNLFEIQNCLTDMMEACSNIHYAFDDDETLINAFDGNEDEAHEFILTFTDLDAEIERLYESFEEMYGYRDDPEKEFNDVTVALIGEWFRILGFDSYREDYFGFESHYLEDFSVEESQKRIMRKTKKEMLGEIGRTIAFLIKYIDVKSRYEYMKAAVDIFQNENIAVLGVIKSINDKYKELFDKSGKLDRWNKEKQIREFEKIVEGLPEKYWVE